MACSGAGQAAREEALTRNQKLDVVYDVGREQKAAEQCVDGMGNGACPSIANRSITITPFRLPIACLATLRFDFLNETISAQKGTIHGGHVGQDYERSQAETDRGQTA